MNRRTFTRYASGLVVGSALGATPTTAHSANDNVRRRGARFEAVLFDAFPIFDPRPMARLTEELFPGRGAELISTWRARQFDYAWLRVVAGDYADFWRCTDDALRYAASALGLELTTERRDRLMNAHLALPPWPDVRPALESLRGSGVRLGFLSNFTKPMLEASIRSARLDGLFEHVLSTDQVQTYKPDPRAYQLGVDALGLGREQILFAAFAGWDASGAKRFGYPTFWVNRLGAVPEQLGAPAPDGTGTTLMDLVAFVGESR
jgi:2-haloacid dehalogenase